MEPIKTIGHSLTGDEQRDCIHVAILPAIAATDLHRGDEVGLVYGTTDQVMPKQSIYGIKTIGIVDPFFGLSALGGGEGYSWQVKKGERCWVFLYPGTVTGLRHHWTLPEIDAQRRPASESEAWLRAFADRWNFDYDALIAAGREAGGYITARGIDLHSAGELKGDDALFWEHLQRLTGEDFDAEHRANFSWSCTC